MKTQIKSKVEQWLSKEYVCHQKDLNSSGIFYTIKTDSRLPYLKILAYGDSIIVCTSRELQASIQRLLINKNKDEIFELPFIYGQTIHYIPEVDSMPTIPQPSIFTYDSLTGSSIHPLKGLMGFENSLTFDEAGSPSAETVYLAKDQDKIIGIASASCSPIEGLWEIGVDVLPNYRQANLGAFLVTHLTKELLAKKIVPFYSASVTNIASQRVASKCHYLPLWVDTYGTTLDGSAPYTKEILITLLK